MTINKRYLDKYEKSMRVYIPEERKAVILERFGEEPEPYEWSEQDITKQIENYLDWGSWEKPVKSNGVCTTLPPGIDF